MSGVTDDLALLIQRGGAIMIPLLALSVVSIALIVERTWFWLRVNGAAGARRLADLNDALRRGDRARVASLTRGDASPYGRVARRLLKLGPTDAVALESVELQRPRLDRFMTALSTIVTAAPLLGILGTVIGIIRSFNLLGQQQTLEDPTVVSAGIAEALLTTALGLIVALLTLFPYMLFRGQASRALGSLESVIAAAQQGAAEEGAKSESRAPKSEIKERAEGRKLSA